MNPFKVIQYIMTQRSYVFTELVVANPITVAPSHAGFQPVERILEYICGVGSCAENLHTQQKTNPVQAWKP